MVKFCDSCENLLNRSQYNDRLVYECSECDIVYEAEDNDTLVYENNRDTTNMFHDRLLSTAIEDAATPKAYVDCTKKGCGGKIAKQVRIGDHMLLYNICMTCRTKWIN